MNLENTVGKRIVWADTARALGIFLVVLGHNSVPPFIGKYIFSFHMPLFFFISGYLFDMGKYANFRDFLTKKRDSILIPYFVFSFISYVFWAFFAIRFEESQGVDILTPFIGIFYSNNKYAPMTHNGVLWFLTCLFIVELMFYLIRKKTVNDHTLLLLLIASSIVGYLGSVYVPFGMPWSTNVAFTGIVFFGLGYLAKNNQGKICLNLLLPHRILIILLCLGINVFFCSMNGQIDMNVNRYHNYFYFYIESMSGIGACIAISQLMRPSRVLSYLGANTLLIFALHGIVLRIIKGIQLFMFGIPLELCRNSLVWGCIYTIGALSMLIPVMWTINKYVPFIAGIRNDGKKFVSVEQVRMVSSLRRSLD